MAVTKETLKKHHFWILVGATPLLVLIAVLMIDSGVGAEIEKKNKTISDAEKALSGKDSPKSEKVISLFSVQLDELGRKRTDLWKENWERQIGLSAGKVAGKMVQDPVRNLLRWPNSKKFDSFNYTPEYASKKGQLKFGDAIPNENGEYTEFTKREVYIAEYSNPYMTDIARETEKRTGMADRVYPTSFVGGWQAVLRHVQTPAGWGDQVPKPEQLWLVLEDIWVQRSILDAVKQVNDSVSRFQETSTDETTAKFDSTKLEKHFTSRIWRVKLKVAQRPGDGRYVISGTIWNLTDRLQLTGSGNTLVLNVWLSSAPGAQPIPFRIGGEFVPGRGKLDIAPSDDHILPAGTTVEEIVKVEQIFDTKTVPIRRIDHVALGKRDSRHAAFPLVMPLFESFKKEADAAEAAKSASSGTGGPMGGSAGGPPPGSGGKPTPGAPGGNESSSAAEGQLEGAGPIATVVDGNRRRYVEATKQIRRMPVGITVIVDQAYMHDVLMAYANLPMRFQITQSHWQRFRGSLGGGGVYGGGSSGGDDIAGPARGLEGSGGIKFGSGSFAPGGPGPMGPSGPGMPSGPKGPATGGTPSAPAGSFSEAQLTAGLVELTIYGIVSIYEKYENAEPATGP